MRLLPFLCLLLVVAPPASGQPSTRPLVVMNLAAHPDDEDGATLAYYRHAKDAVAYSVIFTRGEGGQNEIGPELYEALGALRTQETEQAARVLGTQVFFLNYNDFGFSKHAHEAFEMWGGRDAVTARLVRLIRELKPDVLFTNHDTVTVGANRQHGQHQAVGIAAYDAFRLAADPTYHPEQLDEPGVDLWQPKRLFLRRWQGGDDTVVAVPVGEIDPALGISYAELAARALHEHASQGMDLFADRLRRMEATHFVLLRSATDAPLSSTDLAANLPPNHTAQPDLTYWIDSGRTDALPPQTLTLSDSLGVPGQRVRLQWDVEKLPERRLQWKFYGALDTTLYLSDTSPGVATLAIPAGARPSRPRAVYQYERFRNREPVWYGVYRAGTDHLLAAGYLPLHVAPPLVAGVGLDVARLRPGLNRVPVHVEVFDPAAERLQLALAVSRDADRKALAHVQFDVDARGVLPDTLAVTLPDTLQEGAYTITLTGLVQPGTLRPVAVHDHVAAQVFEVAVPQALRVGLVQSYDNTLAQALAELGVSYVLLDSTALAGADFDDLHTILVDIRAYLVRSDLRRYNEQLLDWVRRGGHLVVNYQKTFEWNPEHPDPFAPDRRNPADLAPYPLHLGRDRVTYEDAPVTVLAPEHPLFHRPNPISPNAWSGWIQERGLYFPDEYDPRYQELFSLHDPGEPPLRGSTLLARYGQGTYLYTALVWYRQLKVYHPGAYALFANLISLPLTTPPGDAQP